MARRPDSYGHRHSDDQVELLNEIASHLAAIKLMLQVFVFLTIAGAVITVAAINQS